MKNIFLLLSFLILSGNFLFVQAQKPNQKRLDSLLKVEKQLTKDDTNKVFVYNQLANLYFNVNRNLGIEYAKKAIQVSEKIGYKRGLADNYNYLGVCLKRKSDMKPALEYYLKSLKIYEELGLNDRAALISGNIGTLLLETGEIDKSIEYYNNTLKYHEKVNDKGNIAFILGNLANVYIEKADFKKALQLLDKAYKINSEIGNEEEAIRNVFNKATLFTFLEDYDNAIKYFSEAKEYYQKVKDTSVVVDIIGSIGGLYIYKAINTKLNLTQSEKNHYLNLAIENNQFALDLSRNIGDFKKMHYWYENLADANKAKGNWKNAYLYADSSYKMEDSVNKMENRVAINKLEEKRQKELKEKENEILKKDNQIQKEAGSRQLVIIYATIGGLVLLVVLAIVLYGRYRAKQKTNLLLTEKNEKIEKANIEIAAEREKSDKLLLNILPVTIADRLKSGEATIADYFDEASVMFVDLSGFTKYSSKTSPPQIVNMLNNIFVKFDNISAKYGIEKIKTIGDCYMAASGIPVPCPDHAEKIARMALEVKSIMDNFITEQGDEIKIRVGLHCGPVVAGVIGKQKFIYDLWGDTVNTASRMESTGAECRIQVTESFKNALNNCLEFHFEPRGEINVKGKGAMTTYFLESVHSI